MKSESGSAPRPNKWRLKKTLGRDVKYRPIEDEDMRYTFAAYKKGALEPLGEPFDNTSMTADQFKETFERFVVEKFHAVWTLFATTKRGFIPVGLIFAVWVPSSPYMTVNALCWFPWASRRNIIECCVSFLNSIRTQVNMMFYAAPEHKRTYEVCAMHGVIRRIGTSHIVFPGKPAAVFETRAKA